MSSEDKKILLLIGKGIGTIALTKLFQYIPLPELTTWTAIAYSVLILVIQVLLLGLMTWFTFYLIWFERFIFLNLINFFQKIIKNLILDKNVFLVLPEDWRGNLEVEYKRLLKSKASKEKIRWELFKMFLGMFWGTLCSKIEDIYLPKRKPKQKSDT